MIRLKVAMETRHWKKIIPILIKCAFIVLFIVFVSLFRNAYDKEMKLVSVCFTDAAWDKFDEKKK